MAEELEHMREFRNNGGKVLGYLCQAFPPAVAAGLGMWPVRVLPEASTELEDLGSRLVRPDICPLVKVLLGGVSTGAGLFGMVDVWIGLATCDQTRRCFSILPGVTGAAVHHIQLPATRSMASEEYYCRQIGDFCSDAVQEGHTDGNYDPERAAEYSKHRYHAGEVLARAALSGGITPLDMHWMFSVYHMARPEGLSVFFSSLIESDAQYSPGITISLAGSSIPLEDVTLLRILQDAGADVIPLHCSALQSVPFNGLNEMTDLFDPQSLAAVAFRSVRCARSRPNEDMFTYLEDAIRRTSSKGLVVKTMKFCDLWFTERVRLRERINVPVLVLDTSYGTGEAERQANRLEAFLETLEHI